MRLTVAGCWGGSPRPGGACSGYLVQEGATSLLLDCGSGVAGSVARACPLAQVSDVFVSHYHFDHVSDAGALMFARLVGRQVGEASGDVTFYALAEEPRDPHGMLGFSRLAMDGASRAVAVDEGACVRVGPLALTFLRTRHPAPCLAVRVEGADGAVLAYTADSALTPELAAFCAGADVLLAECSLYAGVDGAAMGHMSAPDVARLAELVRPTTLVLTHLPIYGDVRELLAYVRAHVSADACGQILLAGAPMPGQAMLALDVTKREKA